MITRTVRVIGSSNQGGPFSIDKSIEIQPRFPGDPGPNSGKVMSGSTIYTELNQAVGLTWLDTNTAGAKGHKIGRLYGYPRSGSPNNQTLDFAAIDAAHAMGVLPAVSWKFAQWTNAQIVAGSANADLVVIANGIKARNFTIWLAFGHEMLDNYLPGTAAAGWRAACRYIILFLKAQGVTNVAFFGPSLMCDYEYLPGGETARGGMAYHGDPDWKGTMSGPGGTSLTAADWYTGSQAVIDIWSFDQYSPYVGNLPNYKSFGAQVAQVKARLDSWNRPKKPWFVPEIGTMNSPNYSNWPLHWKGAATSVLETCIANDIIGYCYFNFANGGGASFMTEDPGGTRLAAYNTFFQDARVVGR